MNGMRKTDARPVGDAGGRGASGKRLSPRGGFAVGAVLAALLLLAAGFPGDAEGQGFLETSADASVALSAPSAFDPAADLDQPSASINYDYCGSSNYGGSAAGFEAHEWTLSGRWSRFMLEYTHTSYVWHDLADLPYTIDGSVPWESLNSLALKANVLKGRSENWCYKLDAKVSSGFENFLPGAVGIGMTGELAKDIGDGWLLGLAGNLSVLNAMNSDLLGEMGLTVTLHVPPEYVEQTLAELGIIDLEALAPGSTHFEVALTATDNSYRLGDSNAMQPGGYLGITQTMLGAYLTIDLNERLSLRAGPEMIFSRTHRIYNRAGSLEDSHVLGSAFGGSLGATWRF